MLRGVLRNGLYQIELPSIPKPQSGVIFASPAAVQSSSNSSVGSSSVSVFQAEKSRSSCVSFQL